MNEPGTYEERVGRSIDALYDTATILTGDRERAESLVVTAVVEASRRYRRDPPEGDFRVLRRRPMGSTRCWRPCRTWKGGRRIAWPRPYGVA